MCMYMLTGMSTHHSLMYLFIKPLSGVQYLQVTVLVTGDTEKDTIPAHAWGTVQTPLLVE